MARTMSGTKRATWKNMDSFFPLVSGGTPDASGVFVVAPEGSFKLVAHCVDLPIPLKNITTNTNIYAPSSAGTYASANPPLATASVNNGDKIGILPYSGSGEGAFAGYVGEIPKGLSLHAFARNSNGAIYTATQTTSIYLIALGYSTSGSSLAVELRKSTGEVLHRQYRYGTSVLLSGAIHLMKLGGDPYTVLNASQSLQISMGTSLRVAGFILYG
jgi:hypothetical protein